MARSTSRDLAKEATEMSSRSVSHNADGSGPLVMLANATDTGMVSVHVPDEFVWVTPDTAERMATALTFEAQAARRPS